MSQYNNLNAIIESKRLNLMPSPTSAIKEISVQEGNASEHEADKYLNKSIELDGFVAIKTRLELVYTHAKPIHKLIWNDHFIQGRRDYEIYYGVNDLSKRTYYREKDELMNLVAECLGGLV